MASSVRLMPSTTSFRDGGHVPEGGGVDIGGVVVAGADVPVPADPVQIAVAIGAGDASAPDVRLVVEGRVRRPFGQVRQRQGATHAVDHGVRLALGVGGVEADAEPVERRGEEVEVTLERDLGALDRGAVAVHGPAVGIDGVRRLVRPQQGQRIADVPIAHRRRFGGDEGVHLLVEDAQSDIAAPPHVVFP